MNTQFQFDYSTQIQLTEVGTQIHIEISNPFFAPQRFVNNLNDFFAKELKAQSSFVWRGNQICHHFLVYFDKYTFFKNDHSKVYVFTCDHPSLRPALEKALAQLIEKYKETEWAVVVRVDNKNGRTKQLTEFAFPLSDFEKTCRYKRFRDTKFSKVAADVLEFV